MKKKVTRSGEPQFVPLPKDHPNYMRLWTMTEIMNGDHLKGRVEIPQKK